MDLLDFAFDLFLGHFRQSPADGEGLQLLNRVVIGLKDKLVLAVLARLEAETSHGIELLVDEQFPAIFVDHQMVFLKPSHVGSDVHILAIPVDKDLGLDGLRFCWLDRELFRAFAQKSVRLCRLLGHTDLLSRFVLLKSDFLPFLLRELWHLHRPALQSRDCNDRQAEEANVFPAGHYHVSLMRFTLIQ